MLSAFASATGDRRVAVGGDENIVTSARLEAALRRSVLSVRYVQGRAGSAAGLTGVARFGGRVLGFEFQLFKHSDEATVRYVGKLQAANFGWPKEKYHGMKFRPRVRGVMGNVAFAEYERSSLRRHVSSAEALRLQLAYQRLRRAIDDSLFNAFGGKDAYANALLDAPN